MFAGVYELNIDEKGRLAIPARFRDMVRAQGSILYCTLKNRQSLLLFTETQWRAMEEQLLGLNTGADALIEELVTVVLGNATPVDMDAAGRILLPAHLRKLVNFGRETTLVGRADRMVLWGRDAWNAQTSRILDADPNDIARRVAAQAEKLRL